VEIRRFFGAAQCGITVALLNLPKTAAEKFASDERIAQSFHHALTPKLKNKEEIKLCQTDRKMIFLQRSSPPRL
jgi:hypothetical protein